MTFRLSPLVVLIAAMLLLGIFLRIHAFSYPDVFLFDEHHFVGNARNYLTHSPDQNDHPPLGKLIIARSIAAFGDKPVGWRMPALICGMMTMFFSGLGAGRLFRSARAGWLTVAFISVDGFLSGYSRAALLDGFLAGSLAVAFFLTTLRINAWTAIAAGAVAGFAVSIKFSGIGVILPFVLMVLLAKIPRAKIAIYGLIFGATLLCIYVAQYAMGLTITHQHAGLIDVFRDTRRLLVHHAVLTDMKNPLTSGWITWAVPTRSIVLGYFHHTGSVRVLSSLGNLALWWPGIILTITVIGTILAKGILPILRFDLDKIDTVTSFGPTAFIQTHGRVVFVLLSGVLGFLAPWVMTHRDSYIYHFLPCYLPILLLLAGYVDWVGRTRPRGLLMVVGLVLIVASYFTPVWSMMDISEGAVNARLFWEGWR
jgi:dolichyl-phosphate-mannose-protein mannosyltransferase